MKKVITFGTFDFFHVGHLRMLLRAADCGEALIVGVSTDALNVSKKGRPTVYSEDERMGIAGSIQCVDNVFPDESLEQKPEYKTRYGADILVMGDDWEAKFEDMKDACKGVCQTRTPAISSSAVIEKIRL